MNDGLYYGASFPQHGGPWVSVMFSSRGRPDKLERTLRNWQEKCLNHDKVEYLIAADDDDEETIKLLTNRTASLPPRQVIVGPRGRGYLDMHLRLDAMCRVARGDWFLAINDDATVRTEGWERVFNGRLVGQGEDEKGSFGCPDGIYLFIPKVPTRPDSPEFFAVHRRVWEVLGRLAPNMGVDDWLYYVMDKLNRVVRCSIEIDHTDDDDKTYQEGRAKIDAKAAYELTGSLRVIRDRLNDIIKLMDYIEAFWGACGGQPTP